MHSKIISLLLLTIYTLQIDSSVAPVAPPIRYTLITPQNIRPFAAQVSTFTKGLDVFSAPLAAGVLNPPAIFSKTIAVPPLVPGPAAPIALPAPVAAPAYLPAPVAGPSFLPAPPSYLPAPVAAPPFLPAPSFLPAPISAPAFYAAPDAPPYFHGAPAHVLPVPNARSVHAVAPAVGQALW